MRNEVDYSFAKKLMMEKELKEYYEEEEKAMHNKALSSRRKEEITEQDIKECLFGLFIVIALVVVSSALGLWK